MAEAAEAEELNSSLNDFVVTEDAIKADEAEDNSGNRRKSQRIRRNHQLKIEAEAQKMAESEVEEAEEEEDRSVSDLRTRPQKRPRKAANRRRGAKKSLESLESQLSDSKSSNKAKILQSQPPTASTEAAAATAFEAQESDDEIKIEKVVEKPIAPIFGRLKAKPKTSSTASTASTEDPAKAAARKAFLLSSVPDVLKTQVQKRCEAEEIIDVTPFASTIGHVTQLASEATDENFPLEADATFAVRRNFLEDVLQQQPFAIKTSMAGYHGKELKVSKTEAAGTASTASMEQKSPRLTAPQIYSHFLSIRQGLAAKKRGSSSETASTASEAKLQFTRAFRRYLERKIEADTLEEEARSKNVSLNEIEEKRGLAASRRLRSKSRKKKTKEIKPTDSALASASASETKVKYDPDWPSSMQWTMKYAPQCAEDIIGNSETVKELASWLGEWEMRDVKRRKRCNGAAADNGSDSDSDSISTYR